MNSPQLQRGVFLALLAVVTAAFIWVLLPFFGAVLWGVALAILFTPLYKRLLRKMPGRKNLAALATLAICLVIVILPLAMIGVSLVQEIALVTQSIRSGELNFAAYFQQILDAAPRWAINLIERFNLGDMEAWQKRISEGAAQGGQVVANQALSIGQNTFDFLVSFFVMLYLLYFLVRDGSALSKTVRDALPLAKPHTHYLLNKFTTVIRATVKGNVAVAVVQGTIGGIAFWFLDVQGALLWAVLMAFLSLLPAVGAALIWGPVAIYFLATGQFLQAGILIFVGVFVIGLVDNILRPILVGKDTQMPDYIVLMSTIGGMALFGINGFVIGPVIAALFMATWDLFAISNETDGGGPQV
ncbi:MAG: AI-2E family transporter [Variovorax sp.]|nr:MAG: AI-2E family transporter [Variovorax sp.]